jgi:hypothetical protein
MGPLSKNKKVAAFWKKAAQKLFGLWAWDVRAARAQMSKVFLLLFVHKK